MSQDNITVNMDLSSEIPIYTLATIPFCHVFELHIPLYLVISCVQILYLCISLHLSRENSVLFLVSLSTQNCVEYITNV